MGVPAKGLDRLELRLDELEALRLADLQGLHHVDAADEMGISRATFGRLVAGARHKVAEALIHGKLLAAHGGNVRMIQERIFACETCGHRFTLPCATPRPKACPECAGKNLHRDHTETEAR